MKQKAILIVSFGTSHVQAKQKTIDRIEQCIREQTQEYEVLTAFTSERIRTKLQQCHEQHVHSVEEALQWMVTNHIQEVIVQPTYLMDGVEYQKLRSLMLQWNDQFSSVVLGTPLLSSKQDVEELVLELSNTIPNMANNEALVWMAHGSKHTTDAFESCWEDMLQPLQQANWYVATIEGTSTLSHLIDTLKNNPYDTIWLSPLLFVAGMHATRDLVGDEPHSWEQRLIREGFQVKSIVKGLGEYECMVRIILRHIHEAQKV